LKNQVTAGEAARAKVNTLQQVVDKKAKSKADYTAQRPGLLARWQTQRCEILHLIANVTADQPKWSDEVHAKVCGPLKDIVDLKVKLAGNQKDLVLLQASTDLIDTPFKTATRAVKDAQAVHAAWMDISAALGNRLTALEAAVAVAKRSTAPKDAPGLYAVFFELLPELLAIVPTDAPNDLKELMPFADNLKDCVPLALKPPPQLVTVDELSDRQNAAWAAIGAAQADLQAALSAIAAGTKAVERANAAIQAKLATLKPPPAAAAARAA
jgi:hypothetical protein